MGRLLACPEDGFLMSLGTTSEKRLRLRKSDVSGAVEPFIVRVAMPVGR